MQRSPQVKWDDLCTDLGYSAKVKADGYELLQRLQSSPDKLGEGTQSTIQGQLAAAAYLASSKGKSLPGISVTQLCSHLSMHIKDFCQVVLEQHTRLYPGIELTEIVPVKRAFLVSTVVHAKWKDFSRQLFPTGFAGATATDTEATVQLSFELGWLLFALGKCHMASGATDPLSAYHLLAALVHLLLALIPEEAQTSSVFWRKLDGPISVSAPQHPLPVGAQEHLWRILKAVPAEISKQQATIASLLTDLAQLFHLNDVHNGGELTPAGGAKLRQLLAPGSLSRTVEAVRSHYAAVWADKSQLDDAFYLLPQAASPARPMHSPAASPYRPSSHAIRSSPGMSSPGPSARHSLLTPLRGVERAHAHTVPQTPMSSQLESVGWLREAVQHEASVQALSRFYDACESSPRQAIDERVAKLSDRVHAAVVETGSELSSEVAEQLQLGRKLYYKMLLAFLEAEERRQANFKPLLNIDAFHTSLFACCLESVFASYSTTGMAFPAILTVLELQPFDFGKVIESFIKHEPHLPTHLKVHFADVEAKIVESLAWQESSPLHGLMSEYEVAISSGSTIDGAANPGATRAKAALEQFVKKCLYLGAKRIQDMCLRLLLPSSLVQQVWAVVKLVLDKARQLLVGRHLDQLLMCAVYGVCKVSQKPVTFRHIIEQYRRQPGASPRTFREVRMREVTDPPQDIIQFYNLVFIPAMKDHLLRVCAVGGAAAAPATAPPAGVSGVAGASAANPSACTNGAHSTSHMSPDISEARGTSSPRHVSAGGARDLYVSACSTSAHLTPRTRTLYAFTDTPASGAERLRDINTNINGQPGTASPLDMLGAAAGGAQPAAAGGDGSGDDVVEPRRARGFDLTKSSGTVMSAGHKRRHALMEPPTSKSRSGSSAGSSVDDADS